MTGAAGPPEVLVFAPDLMDRSRISSVLPHARFLTTADQLAHAAPGSIVLVDLHRPGVLEVIPAVAGSVIGFASHVDDDLLRAGRAAGCTEVLPRSRFFRRLADLASDPPAGK
jgi:hypothetical protein